MNFKKGLVVLAALLALGAVACNGGNNDNKSSKNPSSQTQKIKVTAEGSKTELEIGDTVQLSSDVKDVTWSSTDVEVASVTAAGLVTAVKPGSVTIKAVKDGYKDGSIDLKVKLPDAPHPAEPTWPAECPAVIDTSAWTEGTPVKNLYGKDYTPLTGPDGSVGVKIALGDSDPESASTFDADGKLGTEATSYVSFRVKVAKPGIYQMILKASCSSSGDSYKFAGSSSRGFDILVNGYDDQDNVYGDRLYTDAGLNHDTKEAFVFGLVQLNGSNYQYDEEISFRNPYYRLKFDLSAGLILAENK